MVFAGHHERYAELLPEGAAAATERLLLETGAMQPWMQRFYASARGRAWLERLADRLAAGQLARMALRKRFMDDEIRAGLAAGATQVLVVGAGYDTACMRLAAKFEDRLFVEIDHPATHASKRAGIEALGAARPNLRLIGADLGEATLVEALSGLDPPAWDAEAQTVVVAEGVLMYLCAADVARFFEAAHDLCGAGSRVVFSYLKCDAEGRPSMGGFVGDLSRWSLKLLGEAMQWCVADEAALAELVAPLGWRYEPEPERFDLGTRYLAPAGIHDHAESIEFMAVAYYKGA